MQRQQASVQPGLQARIMELLRDEGWSDITLQPHNEGMRVEAHHAGDLIGKRVSFGLAPADLDAIGRASGRSGRSGRVGQWASGERDE